MATLDTQEKFLTSAVRTVLWGCLLFCGALVAGFGAGLGFSIVQQFMR